LLLWYNFDDQRKEGNLAMRMNSVIAAMAALIVSTVSALALETSMTVPSPLSPDALWKKVGDFCGMTSWNPVVEKCVLSADGKQRTVFLFGGIGTAVATLENWDNPNRSFTYRSVSAGLLPVANSHTTVSVIENAKGSALKMTATYDVKGVSDADAKRAADDAMYRSLCFNSPLLCSPDQRSVAPAELVKFDSNPPGPTPLVLQGYLRRPSGAGPFAAVVLWHGCGGLPEQVDQDWGAKVASWGYVALTIDSFGPREIKNTCRRGPPADMTYDAYRALNFLVQQQFVDPKRVVAVGFSQGGWLSLSSVERGAIEQASENKFRAAAAFYPVCSAVKGPMTVPTLIMTGESDDWTPAEACRKLVNGQDDWGISRKEGEGVPIQLIVYPNAYHAFDLPSLLTPITYFGHHLEFNKSVTDQSSDALREFLRAKVGGRQ
jgi:dienelactone hydrolase